MIKPSTKRVSLEELFRVRLITLMRMRGVKLQEVAEYCEVHRDTVRKWKKGRALPRLKQLHNLVVLLECSADYMLGLRDTTSR